MKLGIALLIGLCAIRMDAQLVTKKALTLEAVKKIAAAAEAEALKNKWSMAISIVDDGGHMLYFERMDGTQLASIELAQMKARTALLFRRPTKVLQGWLNGGAINLLEQPGVAPDEGGVPIIVDGEVIGAVGASGASGAQDAQVSAAGAAAIATPQ
jgi:uncharacterized protein GlcG (DUF336 family)